ncbi:hypothetical protein [Desulfovibrio inopinatus]|uniref:hypothetical protein n=1 Tax=Desulfovibrio inopinatus TaxID=102109 RepID=UPI00041C47FF|nr:hypothetical protein [Desulfovibrio inopinatus]
MQKNILQHTLILLFIIFFISPSKGLTAQSPHVSLTNLTQYYRVTVDLTDTSTTRPAVWQEYGTLLKSSVPNMGALLDSLIHDACQGKNDIYTLFLLRTSQIRPQVPEIYQNDVNAIALGLVDTTTDTMGDGLLSTNELWLLNLLGDVARQTQCSGFGVLPEAAASGKTTVVRNLDWDDGSTFQLSQLQAVTTITFPDNRKLTLIGYLGAMQCITGIVTIPLAGGSGNTGLFAAILDSETGQAYTSENKRSFPFDLLYGMETLDSLAALVTHLQSTSTQYSYGHLTLLADKDTVEVLENDLLPGGSHLRTVDSAPLYHTWSVPNTIGAVNCNMLPASFNNSNDAWDTKRWESMQQLLNKAGPTISRDEMESIAGYGPGLGSDGYLYIINPQSAVQTQQIILFEPETFTTRIAFHPVGRSLSDHEHPVFQNFSILPQPYIPLSLFLEQGK